MSVESIVGHPVSLRDHFQSIHVGNYQNGTSTIGRNVFRPIASEAVVYAASDSSFVGCACKAVVGGSKVASHDSCQSDVG